VLKAAFTYEPGKDRLNGVSYRSIGTGRIIEGSKCRYDAAGNRIEEIQLRRGRNSGQRYFYDSANRLVKAQYGVEHLSDPDSDFEKEEIYELSSTGFWRVKTTRDANGKTLEQDAGTANAREAYVSLGNRHFEYDANGNRILEGNGDENAKKRFSYDYADRLVRVENLDKKKVVQSLEYAYDAFNRQILKRLSNGHGTIETRRTWAGEQLIEEIEGDRLARSFIYGSGVREPVKMRRHRSDGTEEALYMLNVRGVVTGLINEQGDAVECYDFDVFGEPSISEEKGMSHGNAQRLGVFRNPVLVHGKVFDGDAGLYFGGGFVSEPSSAQGISARSEGGFGPERSNRQQSDEPKEDDKPFSHKVIDFLVEHAMGEGAMYGSKKAGLFFGEVGWLGVIVGLTMGLEDDVGGHSSDPDFGRPADVIDPNSRNGGELDDYNDWIVGDPVDVHDLPNVDIPTVGVHELPDAPIPVHDLPDAAIPVHDLPDADPGYVNRPVDIELDDDGGWVDNRTGETGGGPSGGGDSGSDSGGVHGGGCFVADTLVALGDGSTKPIGVIQVGDHVVSRNEATGETTAQRVLRTWIHNVKATLLLHLTNGEKVETTKGHRFFVADKGFVGAGRLAPGTPLTTQHEETIQVTRMEPQEQNATVYNLEVENFHTYFVGKDSVWVHNLKMSDVDDGEDWDDDGP
jgi:hypothetical protein